MSRWPSAPTPLKLRRGLAEARRAKADARPGEGDVPSPSGRGWPSLARPGEGSLFLLLLTFAAGCHRESAPAIPRGPIEWSVHATADKKEVQVGEALTLTLTVTHPVGGDFVRPPAAAFEPFEVIGQTNEEVSPVESHVLYRLAAYRLPADLEIPALSLSYRTEGGELAELETESIPVKLVTSLTPDVTDIHDIKDPVALEVPRDPRPLLWLLAALVAVLVAYLIYRKLRKRPEEASLVLEPPLPPADVEADAALKRLAERDLPAKGELVLFYAELSEIVRRYAGRRFGIRYLERTTDEILGDLRRKRIAGSPETSLRSILEASDLVKFAKSTPAQAEADACFGDAKTFVDRTRPRAELGATA
jgi:hypothetical protein